MSEESHARPTASSAREEQHEQQNAWLSAAQAGALSWSEFAERILSQEHPQDAKHQPDLDRARRCGFSEVIYGEGKTGADITSIAEKLHEGGQPDVLVTRVERSLAEEIRQGAWEGYAYNELSRTLRLMSTPSPAPSEMQDRCVAVVTAGSTDLPVATEALETLDWMKIPTLLVRDVGVAGPYRLLPHLEQIRDADAVIVVAGMEGALASVVGGLVPCPIVAVPTSVGYGANLAGVTTMLSMLSSCASGVTVVNIDAGFKAAYAAGLIAQRIHRAVSKKR